MSNVKILDCTLRDGGRIIDCKFPDSHIKDISNRLAKSNIDIIELGFLRDKITYEGDSTFFTDVDQMKPFINREGTESMYVAFIDYGMFDFDTLKPYDGTSIDGLRVGFTKKNLAEHKDDIIRCLNIVKEKGYKLFIQGVNSLGYTNEEFLQVIDIVNQVHPYSFGIVDTYGAMYMDDIPEYFSLVNDNLDKDIAIDFHSHNNFQLSFAFSQEVVKLAEQAGREVIIDSTLNGMGKCAGNLNTELLVNFLNVKKHANYDFDEITDIIDEYMYSIKEQNEWGYSIPAMLAGIYKSHPNNIIYLTEQFRLATKDIKYILSMISPDLRQRYDYDNIKRIYTDYNSKKVDDQQIIAELKSKLKNREVLVLLPGKTLVDYEATIDDYIATNNPYIISVNFMSKKSSMDNRLSFFGSEKRLKKCNPNEEEQIIITSNIEKSDRNVVNYNSLIEPELEIFDNSFIMLMNLLKKIGVKKISVAGLDGFSINDENYFNSEFGDNRFADKYNEINKQMMLFLKKYITERGTENPLNLLTPSMYSEVFNDFVAKSDVSQNDAAQKIY